MQALNFVANMLVYFFLLKLVKQSIAYSLQYSIIFISEGYEVKLEILLSEALYVFLCFWAFRALPMAQSYVVRDWGLHCQDINREDH
jgi:hypothetical protein